MKRVLPILILLFAFFMEASGQFMVNGIIKDENTGETLIGAAVILKGTSIGGVTDIDGKFEFTVPESPPPLRMRHDTMISKICRL